MVKNRQGIVELGFAAPAGMPGGIEVLDLDRVRGRVGGGPQRPTFHHLLSLRAGTLRHTVDFAAVMLTPGRWLWVRPGQVQQWGDPGTAEGTLVLFEPDFLDPATAAAVHLDDPHAAVVHDPAPSEQAALVDSVTHLDRVFTGPGRMPIEVRQAILRHLLSVLLLQLAPTGGGPHGGDTFLRFRDAVERDFNRNRRLEDYAHRLGYSARTLSRATQAAAGVNAKDYIDRRVVLEAKRLLAHSEHTAAQIAARLGFTSATNFSKYFHQRTGVTPIMFRGTVRP
ncbi:helix-turn-helix domain-containing protein [Actinoplanes derwentensis]|uniref:AraC-type DNA-binding protein n=1 Tax=Actinoplanes derwentensis TaxID=113562 RepID=A0A1H1Y4S5_9ACTN|nr:AraC family transcriptional regulator [Actinoplanes derwentensis]GID86736.1 AraC family transcriptional regulator [Actinoplanes derwentensis]SDT16036.1 AraC-type DNA-binding protein [Actinoplanes derwentensis]